MEISASTMSEGNAGGNVGNILQMIKSIETGQKKGSGKGMTDLALEGDNGNPFFQILLKQITELMQTGNMNASEMSSVKEELSAALQKLLQGDENATDEILAGLALLAFAGKQGIEGVDGTSNISDGIYPVAAGGGEMKGVRDGDIFSRAGQLTSFIVKAIQESIKDAEGTSNDQIHPQKELLTGETAQSFLETPKQDATVSQKSASEFTAHMENLLKKGEMKPPIADGLKDQNTLKTDAAASRLSDQAQAQSQTTPLNEPVKTDMIKGIVAADSMDAKMNITPVDIRGEKPAMENASVESQLNKAGIDIKAVIAGQVNKQSAPGGNKEEDKSQVIRIASDAADQDFKRNLTDGADLHQNEHRMKVTGQTSKTNISEKDGNPNVMVTLGAAGAVDKSKTDIKGKTAPMEKNPENIFLNSANPAGGVQAKTETGDASASSIINRVAAEFRDNLMTEGGRVKIILTPPSLGSLEMDVSVQNSRVKVMLIAESKDVQKILSGNIETLKGTLSSQGLTIERCDVMMQNNRDEYSQAFTGQQAFGHEQTARDEHARRDNTDKKTSSGPAALRIHAPAGRLRHEDSESISLFV